MLKKSLLLFSVYLIAFSQEVKVNKAQLDVIKESELRAHLEFIASDEMKGRDTGSDELKIVAKYISTRLKTYGFKGLGKNGSFFQEIPLSTSEFDISSSTLYYDGEKLNAEVGKDFAIYPFGSEDIDMELDLVAVKNGILKDGIADYSRSDVEGKIAVRFDTDKEYTHQSLRNELFNNGAKAVVFVVEDVEKAKTLVKSYVGYASGKSMSLVSDKPQKNNPNAYVIMNYKTYAQLLDADGEDLNKTEIYNFSDKFRIVLKGKSKIIKSQNVVAYLEGTDPVLKNEYVGYGAHYDHDGVKNGQIYNGANDDGSGTVGVLNIAKAIATNPPKRSTLIVFHSGEEKGLLGSDYFTKNPLIDLNQLVAMINIDMIGSNYKPHLINVIGADRISKELHDINLAANKASVNLELDFRFNEENDPNRFYFRSDHYNYAKNGVPIIFYMDEDPEHYHKPTDDVEFINFEKLRKVTQLALATGLEVANRKERLKITTLIDKTKKD